MTPTPPWENLTAILEHAKASRAAGDMLRAWTLYARATEIDPNKPQAWAGRAATASDLDDAILSWGYARALAPDNPDAPAALDLRVREKIEQAGIEQVASLISLGRGLAEAGQNPWAYRLFVRATELDDTREEAWVWRGGLTDDLKETIQCLNQALMLNPDNAQAQAGLQWAMARQASAPEPITSPAAREVAELLAEGQKLSQQGEKAQAHGLFTRATELDPRNEMAWLLRGGTAPAVDEALSCTEQALAINPKNAGAREALAWLRVRKMRERVKSQVVVPEASRPPSARAGPPAPIEQKTNRGLLVAALVVAVLVLVLLILTRMVH